MHTLLMCVTLITLSPNSKQSSTKCELVTVPQAFEALRLTRSDPMLDCYDRWHSKTQTLTIECLRRD